MLKFRTLLEARDLLYIIDREDDELYEDHTNIDRA